MRCTDEPIKNWQKCKNKMEKLKKRYRAEKTLEQNTGCFSRWWFYKRMENMVLGTQKGEGNAGVVHANGVALVNLHSGESQPADRLQEEEVAINGKKIEGERKQSEINPSMEKVVGCHENCDVSYTSHEDDEDDMPDEDIPTPGFHPCKLNSVPGNSSSKNCASTHCGMIHEMTSVMRSFAEGFLRLEQSKLELQRDNERVRAETELKRTQMLLASQKQIARLFMRAINNKNKAKRPRIADAQQAADNDH
ncbi:hypothetical protein O6H91_06G104300 [Diphasiastrum complanatum]|nr:hypothetical protein O6H91_06G104300 [Diphasiastrum complanatum]